MALFQSEEPQNLGCSSGLLHGTQRTAIAIDTMGTAKTREITLIKG